MRLVGELISNPEWRPHALRRMLYRCCFFSIYLKTMNFYCKNFLFGKTRIKAPEQCTFDVQSLEEQFTRACKFERTKFVSLMIY